MITFGINSLETSTQVAPAPLWMKSERYDFCDQLIITKKRSSKEKKFSQLNRLLSMFL